MKRLIVRFSDNSGFSFPIPEDYHFGYLCFDYAQITIQNWIENKISAFAEKGIYCTYIGFHYSETKV